MSYLTTESNPRIYYQYDNFTAPWRDTPTMLLQHGFSRNSKFWYNWLPILGNELGILRPDMRGMGKSTVPINDYDPSLNMFTDDIIQILDKLALPEIIFVGESFGGILGLALARRFPSRVGGLVLCNTPCRLPRRDRNIQGEDWDQTMAQGIGAWSTATINMRLDPIHSSQELKDWYIAEMDQTPSEIGRKLQAYLDTLDFRPYLKDVTAPTLLLCGDKSPTSTLDQQKYMEENIPNCELVVYPNLGHGINSLYPDWCANQIRRFLTSHNI